MSDFEQRRKIAAAQLDAVIDVLSGWRGHYEDDDELVTLEWLCIVIPIHLPLGKLCGWLYVRDSATTQGIGWARISGRTVLRSQCGTLHDECGPVTRRQFREAARKSGVSLPARRATAFLKLPAASPPT